MRSLVLSLVSLVSLVAVAHADGLYNVDPAQSKVSYTVVHKLHKFTGISKKVEGKAQLLPDGKAQVAVRIPVESFDSDNVNRDAHMKETVEAAKYPLVELKALGEGLQPPASFPSKAQKVFKAQLTFHGQKSLLDLPVDLTWRSPNEVAAHANFKISLDAFKIERPSLLFVKVDDDAVIDTDLVFKK